MSMSLLVRIFLCIFFASVFLYKIVDRQNELTALRMEIPPLAKQVKQINETNGKLDYEIDRFESPVNLMELGTKPEHSHLKHPYLKDVVILPQGDPKRT